MSANQSLQAELRSVSDELKTVKKQLATLQAEMATWKRELLQIVAREAEVVAGLRTRQQAEQWLDQKDKGKAKEGYEVKKDEMVAIDGGKVGKQPKDDGGDVV